MLMSGSPLLATGAQFPWVALRVDGIDTEHTTELSLPLVRKLGYLPQHSSLID